MSNPAVITSNVKFVSLVARRYNLYQGGPKTGTLFVPINFHTP